MAVLSAASQKDRSRLLQLFPVSTIRENWPDLKGSKDFISNTVIAKQPPEAVIQFVDNNFDKCKQHVFILKASRPLKKVPDIEIGVLVPYHCAVGALDRSRDLCIHRPR